MLINPEGAEQSMVMFRKSIVMLLTCFKNEEVLAELKRIDGMVTSGRAFDALKAIRGALRDRRSYSQRSGDQPRPPSNRFARRLHHGGKRRFRHAAATCRRQPGPSSSARSGECHDLNYDSFLKLLVAQMKNQDPTEPMDCQRADAQLATFSQVEQTIKTNTQSGKPDAAQRLSAKRHSSIGKTVTSADGETTGVVTEVTLYSDGIVSDAR